MLPLQRLPLLLLPLPLLFLPLLLLALRLRLLPLLSPILQLLLLRLLLSEHHPACPSRRELVRLVHLMEVDGKTLEGKRWPGRVWTPRRPPSSPLTFEIGRTEPLMAPSWADRMYRRSIGTPEALAAVGPMDWDSVRPARTATTAESRMRASQSLPAL